MKPWEKAYEDYLLSDFDSDEEEFELLLKAISKYAAFERANKDFFEHPLYKEVVGKMVYRHEEELREFFQAGWVAHQSYLLKGAIKMKRRIRLSDYVFKQTCFSS